MRDPLVAINLAKAKPVRLVAACVVALGVAAAACNPTFNWREFRSADGFAVMLPGRPQTVSREVKLPDGMVQMSMTSTGIGATLFAVGAAQLPPGISAEPVSRERTIAHMREALARNVDAGQVKRSTATLAVPPGDTRKVLAAEAADASGKVSGGRTVQLAARLFIVDDRLFELIAMGTKDELSPEVLDTFFSSFRLI